MVKLDYTELDTRAITLIRSKRTGVLQNDLWKELEISSRDCTRLLVRLLDAGLVTRSQDKNGSSRTYRVCAVVQAKMAGVSKGAEADESVDECLEFDPMLLMAGESIVPCVACSDECNVAECPMLEEWVYDLAFSEIK